jgi:hypothetical protein
MRRQDRILVDNWDYFDGSHAVLRTPRISPYHLQQKLLQAYRGFYSRTPEDPLGC